MIFDERYDAVVVGSGPNGLAAAITLAREGRSVLVVEGSDSAGGGTRSAQLTLPGFIHDVCSSVLPLALASPFFDTLPLAEHGLRYVQPPAPLAHALPGGEAVLLERSLAATAQGLAVDGGAYSRLLAPLVRDHDLLIEDFLGPLRFPRRAFSAIRFGVPALLPATTVVSRHFGGERAKTLFAGLAAHSMLPLNRPGSSAVALVLAMLAHAVGWPFAAGGTASLTGALISCFRSLGGRIVTGKWIESLSDLPPAQIVLLDVTPRQLMKLAGPRLSGDYRRALSRYRYGPGVCKVDYALSEPIPWLAKECWTAGTVHLGSGAKEIEAGEKAVWNGVHPERPFVIVTQPSLFDGSRAPAGGHTAWAYCHVPHGSNLDVSRQIEEQIERSAPGFREVVLARFVRTATGFEGYNPNYVGGDINGGAQDLGQIFTRPVRSLDPYATSDPQLYLCSSATPPGGGVHGLSGYHAARSAMRRLRSRRALP